MCMYCDASLRCVVVAERLFSNLKPADGTKAFGYMAVKYSMSICAEPD